MVMIKIIIQNEMIQGVIAISIFFLLLLTSCAGNNVRTESVLLQHASSDTKPDRLNMELTQKSTQLKKSFSSADYKIGHEDLLEITVFQAKELDTVVRVSASGYIKLPLIDKIEATGLTVYELESLISEKYRTYLADPVVSVFIKEYRSQQIAVLGSVNHAGVFYVSGQRSLLDLLSLDGCLSQDAGDICIIQRNTPSDPQNNQTSNNIVVDLDHLLLKGQVDLNLPMYSGDVILVQKSGLFFVDGAVNSPGSFPLKGKMTITQAISMAKGMSYEAIKSDVKIYRDNGKPERDLITLDYDSILDRKSHDVELKDKDIIIVSSSGLKKFVKGIAGYFNFGFFGLSKAGGF